MAVEKVLKYALIHDLVEIYAGDVITYAKPKALKQKVVDEPRRYNGLKTNLSLNQT